MRIFGLIGRNINYSFSVAYFSDKFQKENITDALYKNFDIPDITYFLQILKKHKDLKGLNVTIPYKQEIIPYLDKLSRKAEEVGAVNTIKITKNGKLKGYNTDVYGFEKSLKPLLKPSHKKALVLGTGGASKAVIYALQQFGLEYKIVSRNPQINQLSYTEVTQEIMQEYTLIINCTPLGTSPNIEQCPELNYKYFTEKHLAYDLIYNPAETTFLKKAKQQGATIKNGHQMLVFQAEKSWEIWNK
jgi:shikimate dehydrogenase